MKPVHLLNLGNARKVKVQLSGILPKEALDAIEAEIVANVEGLMRLGHRHYQFAIRQTSPNWRQKISRLYYGAYATCRAIRLFALGEYSVDTKDHQKFDNLPDGFPNRARYVNQLSILRSDRNTADYDHLSTASDLVIGSAAAVELVGAFLADSRFYLKANGLKL